MSDIELPPAGGKEHFGEDAWEKLVVFSQALVREGELRGLIGPRELQRLWTRHILNSTAVESFIAPNSTVADVGSGAGFPGIVLACIRPDLHVTLIDSMERRTQWLKDVSAEIGLKNVSIRTGRAENFIGRFHSDYVTARAVAALKKLIPWTMPLVKPGGSVVALKGARAEIEIDEAKQQLKKYKAASTSLHIVEPFGCDEETRIVQIDKLR